MPQPSPRQERLWRGSDHLRVPRDALAVMAEGHCGSTSMGCRAMAACSPCPGLTHHLDQPRIERERLGVQCPANTAAFRDTPRRGSHRFPPGLVAGGGRRTASARRSRTARLERHADRSLEWLVNSRRRWPGFCWDCCVCQSDARDLFSRPPEAGGPEARAKASSQGPAGHHRRSDDLPAGRTARFNASGRIPLSSAPELTRAERSAPRPIRSAAGADGARLQRMRGDGARWPFLR